MFRSILATAGYAAELPVLKGKTFTFPETGLVVLFGPNGCGKSTLLSLLATYSGAEAGWTSFSDDFLPPVSFSPDKKPPITFPERFCKMRKCPRGSAANVVWDGSPTYYANGPSLGKSKQELFEEALEVGEDHDVFRQLSGNKGSSGQEQIYWLNKMRKVLAEPPDLLAEDRAWYVYGHGKIKKSSVNDTWGGAIQDFVDYVRSLPRDGKPSVLLDEPDAHMSIPNQEVLWLKALPNLGRTNQVIVATHSPFALVAPSATLIDLEEGYVAKCRDSLRSFSLKAIGGE